MRTSCVICVLLLVASAHAAPSVRQQADVEITVPSPTPSSTPTPPAALADNGTAVADPFNGTSQYNITATTTAKPTSQAAGLSLHEMSLVLARENLSQNVSDAIIRCLANRTWTPLTRWGLYNASQFSQSLIQAEYYAFCATERAQQFRVNVTSYMRGTQLPDCVRAVYPPFGADARIVYARKVIESLPNGTAGAGGAPAWIIGVVVGILILAAFVAALVIMLKKTRIYHPVSYDPEQHSSVGDEELKRLEEAELEKHLKSIQPGY